MAAGAVPSRNPYKGMVAPAYRSRSHAVGIQKAAAVVAVNNSLRSTIFQSADIGMLGDCAEILPALFIIDKCSLI